VKIAEQQESFTGSEPVPEKFAIHLASIGAYLRDRLGLEGPLHARKFRGGQSSPTYELEIDGKKVVLRRRPPGKLLPTAHAIDREFRVMQAMRKAGFPVPKTYVYCEDEAVAGTAFYVVEYVDGRIFWDPATPDLSPDDRRAMHDDVNLWLARIHDADFGALGLSDFGRGENYAARNLKRWSNQYRASKLVDIPDMEWLIDALTERTPKAVEVTLLHGDYGLYNIIAGRSEPRVAAIVDWEMSTLGDPYVDLAHHLRPWWLQPDAAGSAPTFADRDLDALGIPAMDAYVATYCARRGIPSIPNPEFYFAYAQFRYAAMIQGILKRGADGVASSGSMPHRQDRVVELAARTRAMLR
jgi:aminoglycoside phosphotransferase (APT) family kinase protein